jgi:hypothetical protein
MCCTAALRSTGFQSASLCESQVWAINDKAATFLPMTGSPLSSRPAGVRLIWPGRDPSRPGAVRQVRGKPALRTDAGVRQEIADSRHSRSTNVASPNPYRQLLH